MKISTTILAAGLLGGLATSQGQLEIHPGTTLDLGGFPAESAPVAAFELANTGTAPLRVVNVSAKCPCLDPVVYEKTIPPGGSTPLDVFIDGNLLSGSFDKQIHLWVGAPATTNIELAIKGTANRAIDGAPKFIFSGRIPLGQAWSTNLLLHVRSDLAEKPQLRMEGLSPLEAKLVPAPAPGQTGLKLRMPPQTRPLQWQNKIALFFPNHPAIPARIIAINGCGGGTLTPSAQKLKASAEGASFLLQRTYPAGTAPRPAPLSCATPGVSIRETPLPEAGKSSVHLSFSGEFLQRSQKEGRIAIQLLAEGFVPASLVVEPR